MLCTASAAVGKSLLLSKPGRLLPAGLDDGAVYFAQTGLLLCEPVETGAPFGAGEVPERCLMAG